MFRSILKFLHNRSNKVEQAVDFSIRGEDLAKTVHLIEVFTHCRQYFKLDKIDLIDFSNFISNSQKNMKLSLY